MTAHVQLMFQDGRGAEAAKWYAEVVPGAVLGATSDTGTTFSIGDQRFSAFDSPMPHDFDFTPSTSICITVDTAEDVDAVLDTLAADGNVLMPASDYGFADRFGWCCDRYGVSWQVSTPLR